MKYLSLFRTCFKLSVINATAYRANFALQIFQSFINLASALIGFSIVFLHVQTVNGWNYDELLIVVAIYFLLGGILNFMVKPNMILLMNNIWDGKLDYLLLKPIYSQVLVSMRKLEIWRAFDILTGLIILGIVFSQMHSHLTLLGLFFFFLTFFMGVLVIYSFYMILTTVAFWTIKLENLPLVFQSLFDTGRWPVGLYPLWLRVSLVVIVPVAVAVTIPAQVLVGAFSWPAMLGGLVFSCFMFAFSCWFWRFGVRFYTGASA